MTGFLVRFVTCFAGFIPIILGGQHLQTEDQPVQIRGQLIFFLYFHKDKNERASQRNSPGNRYAPQTNSLDVNALLCRIQYLQQESDRPVIDQRHLHVGSEPTGFYIASTQPTYGLLQKITKQ